MRTRLRLGALTLLASALAVGLALAACDAAGRLASAPPSAWGPTALTRALVLLACGAGALGAAWHALSGALAVIALAGPGMGLRTTAAYQDSLWPALVVMLAASVAATAVQLALAICVDKQAVGLAAGALAGVLCSGLPSAHLEPLGWLLPWGVAVAGNPFSSLASFRAHAPVTVAHPWAGALFAVIAAAVWVAAARLAVVHKENHR